MITTARISVSYFELALDFPYDRMYKEFKELYNRCNINMFMECKSIAKRDEVSGGILGKTIFLQYDNMMQKQIDGIIEKYKQFGVA